MVERMLQRSETSGRIDDNIATFEKRYRGYVNNSLPVVQHLKDMGVRIFEVSCDDHLGFTKELKGIDIYSRKRRRFLDPVQRCAHGTVKTMA